MRKKDLYSYLFPIYGEANNRIFKKTCKKIERKLEGLEEEELIRNVEFSRIQIYHYEGMKIAVFNDFTVDAVYVCSDVDIGYILGVDSIY